MNIAIILAGGSGVRMGKNTPKQFIEVFGKPVLVYTLEAFQNHPEIDAIEVVCVKSYIAYLKEVVEKHHLTKVKWIIEGGEDFQHSVMNGVMALQGKAHADDIIAIHWGASPFVSGEIISDAIRVAREKGNAISATPFFLLSGMKDSDEYSTTYIDRETLVCLNSPHAFCYTFIKELYEEAVSTGAINEVEPHTTTLMYKMKKPIYFSKGSQTNIKLTTQDDLDFFVDYIRGKMSLKPDL